MAEMKIAINGAAGRMGQTLIRMLAGTEGTRLTVALEHTGNQSVGTDAGQLAGLSENGVPISDDPATIIEDVDAIIDFTTPETSCALAVLAAHHNKVLVIGTTGFNASEDAEIASHAQSATIIKSGNMSLGVNLLAILVEQAARALEAGDFDLEILEMHHNRKVDAPSGTALLLGEAAARGRSVDLAKSSVRVRDGHTGPREAGTIGFATLRGGTVVGDHSVLLAGNGETIELSHRALDRSIFATGAVKAALWGRDRPAGLYTMRDVLGL